MENDVTANLEAKLVNYTYSTNRTTFNLAEETYPCWGLITGEQGVFAYGVGEHIGEARVGEVIICPPGIALHRRVVANLSFHFFLFRLEQTVEFPYVGKVKLQNTNRLRSTLEHARESRENVSLRYTEHLLNDILYQIIGEAASRMKGRKPEDPAIAEAVRLIHEHAAKDVSLHWIAQFVGYRPSQFTQKFQQEMGISPVKYVTRLRIQKVRALLISTNDSLEQIAEQCGYQNAFYLSRVFSKEMGISPSQYRKTHQV